MRRLPGGWARWVRSAAVVLTLGVAASLLCARPHAGGRDLRAFDPDRVAEAELQMWQAYYTGERVQLFRLLVETLRDQYNLSWAEALPPSIHFAKAAAQFSVATDHYDAVLPDLEAGYRELVSMGGEQVDPNAMARAELAWWVARRRPETNRPEVVGQAIAELYAAAYHVPSARLREAGVLRASAADLRDRTRGKGPHGWDEIAGLLHASYRSLHTAVTGQESSEAEAAGAHLRAQVGFPDPRG